MIALFIVQVAYRFDLFEQSIAVPFGGNDSVLDHLLRFFREQRN